MAFTFNLFNRKRDDDQARETYTDPLGEVNTPSDVLLTTLINGDHISREQALTIPAVAANVDFISGLIATMPVKLFRYKKDHVEEVRGDSRTWLLNNDTGDTLDGYQLKKALVTDYLLGKGGYAYIEKYRNEVTGLFYVQDDYVVIDYNFQPINKSYKIYVEDGTYQPHEFIKLLRNTKTGAWGTGIVDELNDALTNAYQTQLYQLGLVKTGGNKRGFLKSERRLGDNEITALKNAWRNLYANNTENVVVLNNGLDFKEAANTSVEMQLNESIETLGNQIDKIFHITDNFYDTFKFAIYPIIKAFETALNRDLLLEKEKKNYFFEFDVKEIVKANIKERYEVYRIAKECGFMTKNEMRQSENMNEIEGLDVVDLGLGAALYDVNTHTYYTPNTDTQSELKTLEEESIIDHDNKSEA
jgi:HK97 family phage portal protein